MKEVMKKYIKKLNALPTIRYKRSGNAETQPRLPLATKFPNGKTNMCRSDLRTDYYYSTYVQSTSLTTKSSNRKKIKKLFQIFQTRRE
jgi:hypothetical protein